MKRSAPDKEARVQLLLHAVDGTIPYMTPSLLRKYVDPRHVWIGIQVRDTCVVPQFRTDGTNKPCGYTFAPKPIDDYLLPYTRVTVPSFPETLGATDKHVLLTTPHGRHKLTPQLYQTAAQGLDSHAVVSLYDGGDDTKKALRRNEMWLRELDNSMPVWASLILTTDPESILQQVKQMKECQAVAIVKWQNDDFFLERLEVCRNAMNDQVLTILSTRSTLEFITAARAGVNVIGTSLPTEWAKSKRALVLDFSKDCSKRARHEEKDENDCISLDADGCMDLTDTQWARDARPLVPGCTCMACASHSRAYIHHLVQAKELLAEILLFSHNLHHLVGLCTALSDHMEDVYESVKSQLQNKQC